MSFKALGLGVGRVMHYVPNESDGLGIAAHPHLAAHVVAVPDVDAGVCNLVIFAPDRETEIKWGGPSVLMENVKPGTPAEVKPGHASPVRPGTTTAQPGTWHWPERA